jgi:hypothetical protein
LAVIRGDLLMEKLQSETTESVTIDDSAPAAPSENSFYKESAVLLCITLPLLAIGMDLGAGLALYQAQQFSAQCTDDRVRLTQELNSVHQELILKLREVTALEKELTIFEYRFWRDFWRAMLTHAERHAMKKLFVAIFATILLFSGHIFAQDSTNMVVLVDLSKSVAGENSQGNSPCKENFKAVTRTLLGAPAGAQVTILGITEDSFSQPRVLLTALIGEDRGYFGENLSNARQQLAAAWKKRSANLECNAHGTDILGSLLVSSQIIREGRASQSNLIIFSDMRQSTKEFNLETTKPVQFSSVLNRLLQGHLVADLRGVHVDIRGADNAGNNLSSWLQIEDFWHTYFKIANADFREYKVLR